MIVTGGQAHSLHAPGWLRPRVAEPDSGAPVKDELQSAPFLAIREEGAFIHTEAGARGGVSSTCQSASREGGDAMGGWAFT